MNNSSSSALGVVLLFCSFATFAGKLSAPEVLAEASKNTPQGAIAKYFYTTEWQEILNGIGSAENEWLKVYVELRKGADGAASEDLSEALWNVALPNSPYKVFAIENEYSCEFTFEASCPPGGIANYLDRLTSALNLLSTPEQRHMRDKCLIGIKKTRATFKNPQAYCTK